MILHLKRTFTSPTETFIVNQIDFQKNHDSIVCTTRNLNPLNSRTQIFEFSNRSWLSSRFVTKQQLAGLKNTYTNCKPTLIHAHYAIDASFFHPFTAKLNIPKVCSVYGYDVSAFPRKYFNLGKAYIKRVFKEYDAFLAMSNDMANDLAKLGCPKSKIIVHYHGIDTVRFSVDRRYEAKETLNLLTIASLVPKKGHCTTLKAIKHLKNIYPGLKIHYTIIGGGPLLPSLSKYIAENDLKDVVTFKGYIRHGDTIINELKEADIFLHTSLTDNIGNKEGIPGAVVEAMASGLPVISTYHAGIPEIITNDFDGLLVNENDFLKVSALIYKLYQRPQLRAEIGKNAKETASKKFDIRLKSDDLEKIYNGFINKYKGKT